MTSIGDRCAGALIGLVVGDRNGGPAEMALSLSSSLQALGRYDAGDAGRRYLQWWRAKGPATWDCGPTAASVFRAAPDASALSACALDRDRQLGGLTAGSNVCHRVAPLAMAHFLNEESLAESAILDAALTHGSPLAGAAAAATVLILRRLITGSTIADAVASVCLAPSLGAEASIRQMLQELPMRLSSLKSDGFCVHALAAALHFTWFATDFESGLKASIEFAGPANHCPVIAGALLGARFGARCIDMRLFKTTRSHSMQQYAELQLSVAEAAQALARSWAEREPKTSPGRLASLGSPPAGFPIHCALSFLHAFSLVGPLPATCRFLAAACAEQHLCGELTARDVSRECDLESHSHPLRLNATAFLEAAKDLQRLAEELVGRSASYVAHVAAKDGRPSLLHWAAVQCCLDSVWHGRSALMIAAVNNWPFTVAAACAWCSLDLTYGALGSALHMAVYEGAGAAIAVLLEAGAALEVRNGTFWQTPLHVACSRNHSEVVELLMDAAADALARDKDGLTPLRVARMMDSQAAEEVMLRRTEARSYESGRMSRSDCVLA
mmetsp:Transcript_49450/g.107696  ORF Transcript_49450/g.107696 Transcript_49450/m.107696 type:complete len:556 (-) Transcript_49450:72-1739(-)